MTPPCMQNIQHLQSAFPANRSKALWFYLLSCRSPTGIDAVRACGRSAMHTIARSLVFMRALHNINCHAMMAIMIASTVAVMKMIALFLNHATGPLRNIIMP